MRVITFSRYFPRKHPKEGQPTFFVEKILRNYWDEVRWTKETEEPISVFTGKMGMIHNINHYAPKVHTIRAGNRWKVGDVFSPRVWSGKPYASKQIEFAPPIEIKKIWNVRIVMSGYNDTYFQIHDAKSYRVMPKEEITKNDGLDL